VELADGMDDEYRRKPLLWLYAPVELQPSGDTFTQIMATNITFVGIAFTVADDPVAKGEIDPAPWNYLVRMQQSTQNIIFDRCALFMPSASQRPYTVLNLAGCQ
jgi:hypothetical protein